MTPFIETRRELVEEKEENAPPYAPRNDRLH
jgi:hypothetical protein